MKEVSDFFTFEFWAGNHEAIYNAIKTHSQQDPVTAFLHYFLHPKMRMRALTEGLSLQEIAKQLFLEVKEVESILQTFLENGTLSCKEGKIYLQGPESAHARTHNFSEFVQEFSLGDLSTEQVHPLTKDVSQKMHKNIVDGLSCLYQVDEKVIESLEIFEKKYAKHLTQTILNSLQKGGRIFFIGSGSSGRIGVDVAAKWTLFCKKEERFNDYSASFLGVVSGGDGAIVRAKENMEDSLEGGREALQNFCVTEKDSVVLLSASGSATFVIGAGQFAAEKGASVFYIYNSVKIPERTQNFFFSYPVEPVLIDLGPQAIAGSTRLQAASFAHMALAGVVHGVTAFLLDAPVKTPLISLAKEANTALRSHLSKIAEIVDLEYEVFSHPKANFRQITDTSSRGYVTFISEEDCLREIMMDTAECAPTFCTNPSRCRDEEKVKKAEFQAYLLGEKDNKMAWKKFLGREPSEKDLQTLDLLSLAQQDIGTSTFAQRPISQGNCVIFVAKASRDKTPSPDFLSTIQRVKKEGGKTVFIVIAEEKETDLPQWQACAGLCDISLFASEIKTDPLGFIHTLFLKQILNLISNGSMILMNKVFGNQMIDVNVSNQKLLDRAVRFVREIYQMYHQKEISYEIVYRYLLHCREKKKEMLEKGVACPSPIKVALTMIEKGYHFEKAAEFMKANEENIEKLFL